MEMMQQKIDAHEEDHDHEYRDLQRLKVTFPVAMTHGVVSMRPSFIPTLK